MVSGGSVADANEAEAETFGWRVLVGDSIVLDAKADNSGVRKEQAAEFGRRTSIG